MHVRWSMPLFAAAIACGTAERTTSEATTTPVVAEPPPAPLPAWTDPPRDAGAPRPTQISVGRLHACVRMSDDTARCWGGNDWGQLGGGDVQVTTRRATPPISDVVEVAAGGTFSCARKRDRSVWCWGYNYLGAIGTAPTEDAITTPTRIAGISGAVALAAGSDHACVVREDGTAWCWGSNQIGALGDGSEQPRVGPVQVRGLAGATALSGEHFTCARRSDASLACWGMNHGAAAAAKEGLVGVVEVDVGAIGCARLVDGSVHCWGDNNSGQLGRGPDDATTGPAPVGGLTGARAVAAGSAHACAIVGDGAVMCWGDVRPHPWTPADCRLDTHNTSHGGSAAQWQYCPRPAKVPGLPAATSLAIGGERSCVITVDAAIWCWGEGDLPARVEP